MEAMLDIGIDGDEEDNDEDDDKEEGDSKEASHPDSFSKITVAEVAICPFQ